MEQRHVDKIVKEEDASVNGKHEKVGRNTNEWKNESTAIVIFMVWKKENGVWINLFRLWSLIDWL